MRKLFIIIILSTLTISCKKNADEKLKAEIEEKILKGMNDPDSYEFVNFYLDSLEYNTKKEVAKEAKSKIDSLMKLKQTENVKRGLFLQRMILKINEPYLQTKYQGDFEFRANNKFGAKILATYKFKADSTYKLIYLIDNLNDTIYKDLYQETQDLIKDTDKLLKETEELTN